MRSPAVRIALTILLPLLVVVAGDRVLLPGMEELLGAATRRVGYFAMGRSNVSVLALGIMPTLTAYGIVELAAFLRPQWNRLRHGNPEGRVKLERAARVVAMVLAVFQAWGVATSIAGLDAMSGPFATGADVPSRVVIVATLAGGVAFQIVVAEIISRQGIANGYVLLTVVEAVAELPGSVSARLQKAMFLGTLEPTHVVLLVLAVALPAAATWVVLRGAGRNSVHDATTAEAGAAGPYRAARALAVSPWVPVPSSSIAPYAIASSLILLPATLLLVLGMKRSAVDFTTATEGPVVHTILFALMVGAVALTLARLLHRPREMAEVAARLGFKGGDEGVAKARAALAATLVPTLLFFATMLCASSAIGALPVAFSIAFVPLLVALVMDVVQNLRTTKRVAVWQERRASAVPVVCAVLEAEGIDVAVRGMNVLALLQAFAPYAPAELMVPEADAARASAVLRHVFLGDDRPAAEPPAEREGGRSKPSTRTRVAWTPARRNLALGITTAMTLAVLLLARFRVGAHEAVKGPRHRLEIVRVDDEADVMGKVRDADVPASIEIRFENAPVGPGRSEKVHFARTSMREGESYEAAVQRMRAWCDTLALPAGLRIGLEAVEDYDEDTSRATRAGVRTFVLTGASVIGPDDIIDAAASVNDTAGIPEVYVAITLSPEGGERFRIATRDYVQRRLAIIVDDEINSVPVVKAEIGGGHLSITMGAGDPDRQLSQAKALARSLAPP